MNKKVIKFKCNKCGFRYQISKEILDKKRIIQFLCKKCSTKIEFKSPEEHINSSIKNTFASKANVDHSKEINATRIFTDTELMQINTERISSSVKTPNSKPKNNSHITKSVEKKSFVSEIKTKKSILITASLFVVFVLIISIYFSLDKNDNGNNLNNLENTNNKIISNNNNRIINSQNTKAATNINIIKKETNKDNLDFEELNLFANDTDENKKEKSNEQDTQINKTNKNIITEISNSDTQGIKVNIQQLISDLHQCKTDNIKKENNQFKKVLNTISFTIVQDGTAKDIDLSLAQVDSNYNKSCCLNMVNQWKFKPFKGLPVRVWHFPIISFE